MAERPFVMIFENPSGALAFSINDGEDLVLPNGKVLSLEMLPDVWEISQTGTLSELDIPDDLHEKISRVLEEASAYRAKKEKEGREKEAYVATLTLAERIVKGL